MRRLARSVCATAVVLAPGCQAIAGIDARSIGGSEEGSAPPDAGLEANVAGDASDGETGSAAEGGAPSLSCKGMATNCGPAGDRDCCASSVIPGGTFKRSYDGVPDGGYTDPSFVATVSAFRLDIYEVTVGRFRSFAAAYPDNLPSGGAGRNPSNATDPGWDSAWNAAMPQTSFALASALKCDGRYQTWTDAPAGNENKAMTCMTWFEAFAFCIWDGGRLPTEAEWNYAAAGGDEQRVYAWSSPPSALALDGTYAVYSGAPGVSPVGSRSPKGDGKWGQADLAGNVWEWTLDSFRDPYAIEVCNDCADISSASDRVIRSGYFNSAGAMRASYRTSRNAAERIYSSGFRCARSP